MYEVSKDGNEFEGQFCPECGTPVNSNVAPQKKKKPIYCHRWFWVVIALIVVIE